MSKFLVIDKRWFFPSTVVLLLIFLFAIWPLISSSRASDLTALLGYYQSARLAAGDIGAGDSFGIAVAINGHTALIGAPQDDDFGVDSGSVYIFTYDPVERAWSQTAKLHASDGGPYQLFGTSVAIQGNTAFVGAPVHSPGGLVYVFERQAGDSNDWVEVRQIRGEEVTWGDYFGISMDICADRLIVGAYAGGDYDGSAYLFERDLGGPNVWGQAARLVPADNPAYNFFGYSVAISGETAAGGAPGYNEITGAAYLFERQANGSWIEVAHLTPDDGENQDFFGIAVDLDGDTFAAGSPAHREIGAVYVFERDQGGLNGWGQSVKLEASDSAAGDGFGQDVLVDQELIFAGATGRQGGAGAVYVYGRDPYGSWEEYFQLKAFEPAPGAGLGIALAAEDLTLFAGAAEAVPGGATQVYTAYSPPVEIHLALAPNPALEGAEAVLTGSFSDPDPGESHVLDVEWGDGATTTMTVPLETQVFSMTHTYLDDQPSGTSSDPYTLTVTITDSHGGIAWGQSGLTVMNIPPTIQAGADATLHPGESLQRWGFLIDPGNDSWAGWVDYGDGSAVPLELIEQTFWLEHVYPSGGTYPVTVTVTDDDSGQGASQFTVRVAEELYRSYLSFVLR